MSIGILNILFVTCSNAVTDYLTREQEQKANRKNRIWIFLCVRESLQIECSSFRSSRAYLLITFKMLFGFNVIDLIGSDALDRCFSRSSSSSDHV